MFLIPKINCIYQSNEGLIQKKEVINVELKKEKEGWVIVPYNQVIYHLFIEDFLNTSVYGTSDNLNIRRFEVITNYLNIDEWINRKNNNEIEKLLQAYSLQINNNNLLTIQIEYFKINEEDLSNLQQYISLQSFQLIEYFNKCQNGLIYSIQTLKQLLLFYLNKTITLQQLIDVKIINDTPLSIWRGFLLDCFRHYFTIDFIKKLLNLLSFYKFNIIHWHLTDDQGWRMESKIYPNLNTIGSKRKLRKDEENLINNNYFVNIVDNNYIYGNYYTTKEINEIVNYCKQLGILVILEIESIGHCSSLLAFYPELKCSSNHLNNEKVTVKNTWGIFNEILCPGKEETFKFLENLLNEMFTINFKDLTFVYIGGDETNFECWKNCKDCKKKMIELNIYDVNNLDISLKKLYIYFIKELINICKRSKKIMIGWDEILEQLINYNIEFTDCKVEEFSKYCIIQSWRGVSLPNITNDQYIIQSPVSHCYLDYDISTINVKKSLFFNPFNNLQSKVIGGECNCWTERMITEEKVQEMILPRVLSISEALWKCPSIAEDVDLNNNYYYNFLDRLQFHKIVFIEKIFNFKCGPECNTVWVELTKEMEIKINLIDIHDMNQDIYYQVEEDENNKIVKYLKPIKIQPKSKNLKIKSFVKRNDYNFGKMDQIFTISFHQAIYCPVEMEIFKCNNDKSILFEEFKLSQPKFCGGPLQMQTLVNGIRGEANKIFDEIGNIQWFGFESVKRVIIKLDKLHSINYNELIIGCLHDPINWIFIPDLINIYIKLEDESIFTASSERKEQNLKNWNIDLENEETREVVDWIIHLNNFKIKTIEIEIIAHNNSYLPQWHSSCKSKEELSWFFLDQIMLY
ncbi:hypothetical protein ABK040_009525 [Willaertia magna]